MPRDLFTAASPTSMANPRRRWTVAFSLCAHGALLFAIVALSFSANLDGPQLVRRLQGFVLVSPPPAPPPPPPPMSVRPTIATSSAAAPPSAPSIQMPDAPASAPPSAFSVPAGVPGGVPGNEASPAIAPSAPPPAQSALREIPRVGGMIHPPARLVYVPPVYPAAALIARVEGEVVLEAIIDETGAVRNAKVIKSVPILDRAALDAVTRWRYSPTRLNGAAVAVAMTITVRFEARH